MRLLLVSDLHYSLRQFDWLVEQAAEVDVVVVGGDLLDITSTVDLKAQILHVDASLRAMARVTTVVVASGNHDLTGRDADGEKAPLWFDDLRGEGIALDGDTVELDEMVLVVCPFWDGPVGKARLDRQLHDAVRPGDRLWTWVHHWPPLGSPTAWTGTKDYGDADLAGWIAELSPDLVLTGHVHQAPFVDDGSWIDTIGPTRVLNAGREIGPVPASVTIEVRGGAVTATAVSSAGSDARSWRRDLPG